MPKCQKGYQCSATCISRAKNCKKILPDKVQDYMDKVESLVTGGKVSKVQQESLDKLKSMVEKKEITEKEIESAALLHTSISMYSKADRGASRVPTFEEVQAINKNLPVFKEAFENSFDRNGNFDPRLKGGIGDYIDKNIIINKIRPGVADVVYDSLPSSIKSKINKAGSPPKFFNGYDEKGDPIYSDKPTRVRGVMLVKRYMEQGGLDPYSKKPIDIMKSEPEHMVAANKGGILSDQERNLSWASPATNNMKAANKDDPNLWSEKVNKTLGMGREKYNSKVYEPAQQKAKKTKGKKSQAPTDFEKAMEQSTPQNRRDLMKGISESYGKESKYLLRQAGVSSSFQERNPAQRIGRRSESIDKNVNIPGYSGTPSSLILQALSFSGKGTPQYQKVKTKFEEIRNNRRMTDKEFEDVQSGKANIQDVWRSRDRQFEREVADLLDSIPGFNE